MSVCDGCENLIGGECRVFVGTPIPGADGSPCRAKGWVWRDPDAPPPVRRIEWVRPNPAAITAARKRRGLSGQEVSRRAGLPPMAVRDMENGRTTRTRLERLVAIARVLGVGEEELVG